MSNLTKIQTHAGVFHADEVLAVALFLIWGRDILAGRPALRAKSEGKIEEKSPIGDVEIIRSHDLSTLPEMDLVVDIGGKLDLVKGLLDHHQYSGGKAACELMLDWLQFQRKIGMDTANYIRPYLASVSGWDTGQSREAQIELLETEGMMNVPQIISGFNMAGTDLQTLAFVKAVEFGVMWLQNLARSARKVSKSERLIGEGLFLRSGALVCESHPAFWKKQSSDEVKYLVSPSAYKEGQWQVLSRDSENFPLPEREMEEMVFLHNARFIAAFTSKEAAVEYARKL